MTKRTLIRLILILIIWAAALAFILLIAPRLPGNLPDWIYWAVTLLLASIGTVADLTGLFSSDNSVSTSPPPAIDQRRQTTQGPQTNITGDVHGNVYSGNIEHIGERKVDTRGGSYFEGGIHHHHAASGPATNPKPKPQPLQDRLISQLDNNPLWQLTSILAVAIVVTAAIYSLWQIFTDQINSRLFLGTIATLMLLLWIGAVWLLRAKNKTRWVHRRHHRPSHPSRFTHPRLRFTAFIIALVAPLLLISGTVAYWIILPATAANQTIVLIADLRDNDDVDPQGITDKLVENTRLSLEEFPNIRIKRLNRAITVDQGSEQARKIGKQPEYNADIVLWGRYVSTQSPELYLRFEILKPNTYLGSDLHYDFGPGDFPVAQNLNQPDWVEFTANLSQHLTQVTAFTTAFALFNTGQYKASVPFFDTALSASGNTLGQNMERVIRFYRGTNYLYMGQPIDAKSDLEALVPALAPSGTVFDGVSVSALGNLGTAYRLLGHAAEAIGYYQTALAILQEMDDKQSQGIMLDSLGVAYAALGQVPKAISYYQQAIAIAQDAGDKHSESYSLTNLANAYRRLGQVRTAIDYLQQALALAQQTGDKRGESQRLGSLGNAYYALGENEGNISHYQQAIFYHQQAFTISKQLNDRRSQSIQLGNLGLVYAALGQTDDAIIYYEQALTIARQIGDKRSQGNQLLNLGIARKRQGNLAEARQVWEEALMIYEEIQSPNAATVRQWLADFDNQ